MAGPLGATQWMYDVAGFYPTVLEDSLKFNDDESQYLSWTPAAAGNRKTWTWSGWVKRGESGDGTGSNHFFLFNASTDSIDFYQNTIRFYFASGGTSLLNTSQVFRDYSAWYHLVFAVDTTQATASNRIKIYVNGEQITSFSSSTYPALNYEGSWNNSVEHNIAKNNATNYFHGYLSDIHFIDGQALDPTSFGEFKDSIWIPSRYNGTYGTNGFHLEFKNDDTVEGFNTVTYRGTGANQSISGLGFEPDLVWVKVRDGTNNHRLVDSIRGATKDLQPNLTGSESTTSVRFQSFDTDGFTVGSNAEVNASGKKIVGWCWDAGSGSAASNTDGSITSSVKANPSYGFSIVSYTGNSGTGSTVGHGLNFAPEFYMIKNRDSGFSWTGYHDALGASHYIQLDNTGAQTSTSDWNSTSPTSSVFTVSGAEGRINLSGTDYIAYCFNSVAGYSSIGSYSGTGSSGNAVTGLGFKPAWLMIKRTDNTGAWAMFDNTRGNGPGPGNNGGTSVIEFLQADKSNAEGTSATVSMSFDSDGFTVGTSNTDSNASGGTYIYMAFADTRDAAFWRDTSGNNNNWTPNNLDYRDSLIDVPTNNFAVGNPLKSYNGGGGSAMVYAEGNLKLARPSGATGWASSYGSMSVSSGKWFWEAMCFQSGSADNVIGIHEANTSMFQILGYSGDPTGYGYSKSGNKLNNSTGSAYGATYANGDVIGVALDMDAGTVTFYKNGASQGTAFTGLSGDFIAAFSSDNGNGAGFWIANFGQDSTFSGNTTAGGNADANGVGNFKYPAPSGYLALCSQNLPEPTIVDGSEYFNTVLYTGDGNDGRTVTGVGFNSSPNFVWIKERSSTSGHMLQDSVRGATKNIQSASTNAEQTSSNKIQSFDSDGFTLGDGGAVNQASQTYAAWNWLAGGTAVSNTNGSITSQVSANTKAGFSIVSYAGNSTHGTIGHGLSGLDMVIVKDRSTAENWAVWHSGIPITQYLRFNSTNAAAVPVRKRWNDTSPTSTVFSVGDSTDIGDREVNQPGENYIAYCFVNTDGYLKAGSYIGNGSSDGTFVYTGFRPAWIMVKRSSGGGAWGMSDTSRSPDNVVQEGFEANTTLAEFNSANYYHDILSNGFKLRTSDNAMNGSGSTYIFLAFAENPFKYSNAR